MYLPMTELNGNTASLILNGNSDMTIMSEIHHQFSIEYWNDAIESLSHCSLEECDGKFLNVFICHETSTKE